jgi:uroporphyrinogen-III synthase
VGEASLKALSGKRIVITRAPAQSRDLCDALRARGAEVLFFPLIRISAALDHGALDEALQSLRVGDWIFLTSQNAVRPVVSRMGEVRAELLLGGGIEIAVVGPATAQAARGAGLKVAYAAETHDAVSLARELGGRLRGRRVLLPRSDRANADLPRVVRELGAEALEVVAYRTETAAESDAEVARSILAGEVDVVVSFSPSAVSALVEALGAQGVAKLPDGVAFAAIGGVTGNAYRDAGIREPLIAAAATSDAVTRILEEHFAGASRKTVLGAIKS